MDQSCSSGDESSWDGEKVDEYIDPSLRIAKPPSTLAVVNGYAQSIFGYAVRLISRRPDQVEIELESKECVEVLESTDDEVDGAVIVITEEIRVCLTEEMTAPAVCEESSIDGEKLVDQTDNPSMSSVSLTSLPTDDNNSQPVSSETSIDPDWSLLCLHPGQAELGVESALLWCLNPAIYGIKSIGVPPAAERARRLIDKCNGDTSAAVVMASSGSESGGIKRAKIIFEFLLRQVPFVGCPAYILTSTWTHLRSVAIIAAIYGHDVESGRTQHEILWCLLPDGVMSNGVSESSTSSEGKSIVWASDGPLAATARTVSQMLISSTVKRVTGISMVTEIYQLGTDLWCVSGFTGKKQSSEESTASSSIEDEYEYVTLGPSATARHFFCPDTGMISKYKLLLSLLGFLLPWLFRLPPLVVAIVLVTSGMATYHWRRIIKTFELEIMAFAPKVVSYGVFGLHAFLPISGIVSGLNLLWSSVMAFSILPAERLSLVVLSAMSLSTALRSSGVVTDSMLLQSVHNEIRKVAVTVGVIFHVLPLLDWKGVYVARMTVLLGGSFNDSSLETVSLLCSYSRSIQFLSVIISNVFQQILINQLKKREVILRLLGAERLMVLSMTLFFRGITAAIKTDTLLPFIRQITPHPVFCCIVMCARQHALQIAFILFALPQVPFFFPHNSVAALLVGLSVGALAVTTLWNDWRVNEDSYLSNMRLLYILPGVVIGKTKQALDQMLIASGKSAFKNLFVNFAKKVFMKFKLN